MFETPLYLGEQLTPTTFEAGLMALQVFKAIVGVTIAVIAYQGYRRNQSRPMLFIAIGFILVLGIPFLLYLGGLGLVAVIGLPTPAQGMVIVAAELSQVTGLISILYALRL